MTGKPEELTWVRICRARGELRQTVEALLSGSGLDIRELSSSLSVGNPHDPETGRIYIAYATGHVSHRRVTWDFLGPLCGYETDHDPDREPGVDAARIIAALTAQSPPPAL